MKQMSKSTAWLCLGLWEAGEMVEWGGVRSGGGEGQGDLQGGVCSHWSELIALMSKC